MTEPSDREQFLDQVVTRLEAIEPGGDIEFSTSVGRSVHLGEHPGLGPDDPKEAVVVIVDDDEVVFQGEALVIDVPIRIQALVAVGVERPYRVAETVLADVKRAIELPDRNFSRLIHHTKGIQRGSTKTIRREDGNPFVGIEILYTARLHEDWGTP